MELCGVGLFGGLGRYHGILTLTEVGFGPKRKVVDQRVTWKSSHSPTDEVPCMTHTARLICSYFYANYGLRFFSTLRSFFVLAQITSCPSLFSRSNHHSLRLTVPSEDTLAIRSLFSFQTFLTLQTQRQLPTASSLTLFSEPLT